MASLVWSLLGCARNDIMKRDVLHPHDLPLVATGGQLFVSHPRTQRECVTEEVENAALLSAASHFPEGNTHTQGNDHSTSFV